jgi:RNA-directed DNA polymerase
MSSDSYFPPPVRAVTIPKKSGGERILGVPTVGDRIAQMVVKQLIEPDLDPIFLPDSYGYRPRKSALDAVGVTRERCWKYDWVLEFDIKGLFDNLPHELLLKAVQKHVKCKWALLYIERWLTAPMEKEGSLIERIRGTPQGGVISPILSNLFLHYAFDHWITRTHPGLPWCRYADDGLVHCRSEQEAEALKAELQARLAECGLEMHPTKTKIVYCKDGKRKGRYPNVTFDFLGYQFRPRMVRSSRNNELFCSFTPAVSPSALKTIRSTVRDLNIRQQTQRSLDDIASMLNPLLRGWIGYYGRYNRAALETGQFHRCCTFAWHAQDDGQPPHCGARARGRSAAGPAHDTQPQHDGRRASLLRAEQSGAADNRRCEFASRGSESGAIGHDPHFGSGGL